MLAPLLFTSCRFVPSNPQAASLEALTEGDGVLVEVVVHPVRSPTANSPQVKVVASGESFNRFPSVDAW